MAAEAERFAQYVDEYSKQEKKKPQGDDGIIFDEVRVVSRLIWNSRSRHVIGFAMSPNDMASVHDVYQILDEEVNKKQTSSFCSSCGET